MAIPIHVADSVVAQLNAAQLSQPVQAVRGYVPEYDLKEMKSLRVTVVPREVSVAAVSRDRLAYGAQVDIAVQQKFAKGDNAEIDPLIDLVEEIADLFRLKRLDSYPAAIWANTEHRVLYSPEHWIEMRQFTSLLTLTFRIVR